MSRRPFVPQERNTSQALPPVVLADALGAPENLKAFILQKLFHSQLKSFQIKLHYKVI